MRLRIITYIGPPDLLEVAQGTGYVPKEMKEELGATGITLVESPI